MVTNSYPVEVDILLKPVGSPKCRISLQDQLIELTVDHEQWISLSSQGYGTVELSIEHYDKAELDPTTALIIDQIRFNEIISPKFVYQGVYYPAYPKHLVNNEKVISHQNYLSWNGIWSLEFTLPIYTWIHKTLDLGWIYD
jgi:hypothetical protein